MDPAATVDPVRGVRILHGALLASTTAAGVVLAFVRRIAPPAITADPVIGLALALAAVLTIVLAATVLRPRVPSRRFDQPAAAFWEDPAVRGAALVLWVAPESGGLISAVGYYVTGRGALIATSAAAVLALVVFRPGRLEGEGAP